MTLGSTPIRFVECRLSSCKLATPRSHRKKAVAKKAAAKTTSPSVPKSGSATLPESIFGIEPNVSVMHQVVTAQLAHRRSGTQSTKTRSEVRGGGIKPFGQKGTGNARQGSIRAPQYRGGGVVHGYGLAASQLDRLHKQQISLTVAVDKVAASGGYMMACIGNKIIAAPFAIVGSIGVIAQLPNFNRLLKKHNVDFEQFTAGEFKRTVTLFGENTDKGRDKFQQELEQTHQLFKRFVTEHRPQLDIQQVATGEHWFGYQALELKLVDELSTSDEYLLSQLTTRQVYQVKYQLKKGLAEKVGLSAATMLQSVWQQAQRMVSWH